MIRKPLMTASLFAFALAIPTFGNSILRVYTDERHNIHLLTTGKDTVIAAEENQVGIDAVKISENKQVAGWIILYRNPDGGPPIAGKLVVWRDLRILRSFPADQVFWSWAFEHDTEQVAYHVGPAHGETVSHCELHDLRTGRLLSSWDGDLDTSGRPAWTKQLNH